MLQIVRSCRGHSDGKFVGNSDLICAATLAAEVHAHILPPCQLLIRDIRVFLGDAWEANIKHAFEPFPRLKDAVLEQVSAGAPVLPKCIPHYSVLLCKTGWQQAMCHCNHTYEDLLFIQVCSDLSPMHCSTALGIMHPTLLSLLCKTG